MGEGQRFVLHARVFVRVDQIPIDKFDLIDTIDDLQAKGNVSEFAVIFRYVNEAGIGGESKALQQMLGHLNPKRRVNERAERVKRDVGSDTAVVEPHLQIGTPTKALVIGKIHCAGILCKNRHAVKQARRYAFRMIFLQGSGDDRIEAGDEWSQTQRGTDQPIGAGAYSARPETGTAGGSPGGCTDAADATAGSVLHHSGIDPENVSAGFGAQHIGVGNVQIVAGDGDVEIIFQRQSDGVIERKINLAIVHQGINARCVGEIRGNHMPWRVRPNRIRKMRYRLRIVQNRQRPCLRRILRTWRRRRFLRPEGDRHCPKYNRGGDQPDIGGYACEWHLFISVRYGLAAKRVVVTRDCRTVQNENSTQTLVRNWRHL